MVLPVALGSKSVSSKHFSFDDLQEQYNDDGSLLVPCKINAINFPSVTVTETDDRELQAIIRVVYHRMVTEYDGECDHVLAETHVQISPTAASLSSRHRDSTFLIRCPLSANEPKQSLVPEGVALKAFFSGKKYLTCCIPYPSGTQSIVVEFRLRMQRSSFSAKTRPPLPTYLPQTDCSSMDMPVATDPHIALQMDGKTLYNVTALCPLPMASKYMVLAGCSDGRIVVLSHNPLAVAGVLCSATGSRIQEMDHIIKYCDEDGYFGRLAAIDGNGQVHIHESHIVPPQNGSCALIRLSGIRQLSLTKDCIKQIQWVGGSFLAVMTNTATYATLVEVIAIYVDGRTRTVASVTLTEPGLNDAAHSKFRMEFPNSGQSCFYRDAATRSLRHDEYTGCLAISSVVSERSRPFICIWEWRTSTLGYVSIASDDRDTESTHSAFDLVSRFVIGRKSDGSKGLTHLVGYFNSDIAYTRKDLLCVGILSPPQSLNCRHTVPVAQPLMLTSKSVVFPRVQPVSTSEAFSIEWREASLPASYLQSCGVPRIATSGDQSVAVAGTRGVCVLDRTKNRSKRRMHRLISSQADEKWHCFSNESEEHSFRVLAMATWPLKSSADIVVAAVEVLHGDEKGVYLSCWSTRWLGKRFQMLAQKLGRRASSWGVRLLRASSPCSLDIMLEPGHGNHRQRAVILVCGGTGLPTWYDVYFLQLIPVEHAVDAGPKQAVICKRFYSGSTILPSQLFIAGANFDFDFMSDDNPVRSGSRVTLGSLSLSSDRLMGLLVGPGGHLDECLILEDDISGFKLSSSFVAANSWEFHWIFNTGLCHLKKWSIRYFEREKTLSSVSGAGTDEMWMIRNSNGLAKEISIGLAPSSTFGCQLCVSQSTNKLHRQLGEAFERDIFRPDFLEHDLHCVSQITLRIPAKIPVLYALLKEVQSDKKQTRSVDETFGQIGRGAFAHMELMGLLVLQLRLLERMTMHADRSSEKKDHYLLYYNHLATVLSSHFHVFQVLDLTTQLARQIEPSCFRHMFPLHIFTIAIHNIRQFLLLVARVGSVTAVAATAPLLGDERWTRYACGRLLNSCIKSFTAYHADERSLDFDFTREGRETMETVFHFTVRLIGDTDSHSESSSTDESDSTINGYSNGQLSVRKGGGYSLFCGISRWFYSSKSLEKKEEEIIRAANEFIGHNFESLSDRHPLINGYRQGEEFGDSSSRLENFMIHSACTEVSQYLCELASSDVNCRWRYIALIAQILTRKSRSAGLETFAYDSYSHYDAIKGKSAEMFDLAVSECSDSIGEVGLDAILTLVQILVKVEHAASCPDQTMVRDLEFIASVAWKVKGGKTSKY